MIKERIYESPEADDVDKLLEDLRSNDEQTIVMALLALLRSTDDFYFLLDVYRYHLDNDYYWVRCTTLSCLEQLTLGYRDEMCQESSDILHLLRLQKKKRKKERSNINITIETIQHLCHIPYMRMGRNPKIYPKKHPKKQG